MSSFHPGAVNSVLLSDRNIKESICNEYKIKIETEEQLQEQFSCTFCNYSSKIKSNLQSHVEMKHINLRYSCCFWDDSSKEIKLTKKHLKNTHNKGDKGHIFHQCGLCNVKVKGIKSQYIGHIQQELDEYYSLCRYEVKEKRTKEKPIKEKQSL